LKQLPPSAARAAGTEVVKNAAPPGPPEPVAADPSPMMEAGADTAPSALVAEARRALASPPPHYNVPDPPRPTALPTGPPRPAAAIPASATIPPAAPKPETVLAWRGLWHYTPGVEGVPVGHFEPVTIEMRLQEVSGQVRGVYKAQYRVTEPAQSGDVDLRLSGISSGKDWLRGIWSGNRGAYGQFELKRAGDRVIEMSWWTTKFGRGHALASGSARLMENGP
jgi:hypothetical protein